MDLIDPKPLFSSVFREPVADEFSPSRAGKYQLHAETVQAKLLYTVQVSLITTLA